MPEGSGRAFSAGWDFWPADRLQAAQSCPSCGGTRRALLYSRLRDAISRCAPGEWWLYRCGGCGCVYLDPRPAPADIGLAYRAYYTHSPVGAALGGGRFAVMRRGLRNGYLNARTGARLQPGYGVGRWLAPLLLPLSSASFRLTARLAPPRPGARFIDVGAGGGEWVRQAVELGWWACGVDSDARAGALGGERPANGVRAALPHLPIAGGAADAVMLYHVLEHLHEPGACLRELARVLRVGGLLLVATPNADSVLHRRYGRHWQGLDVPRHLVVFTRRALGQLLESAGFRVTSWLRPAMLDVAREGASSNLRCGRDWRAPAQLHWTAAARSLWCYFAPSRADELVLLARKL